MPLRVTVQTGSMGAGVRPPGRVLKSAVRDAARDTLAECGVEDAELSVTLLGDRAIARLNREWLGHDGTTDVLSFPLFADGEAPVGDVYIGVPQARRQAEALGVTLREELCRLAIHGTLHVLGYDHPESNARERSKMWRTQERILAKVMGA